MVWIINSRLENLIHKDMLDIVGQVVTRQGFFASLDLMLGHDLMALP